MYHRKFSVRSMSRACGILIVALGAATANADTIDDAVAGAGTAEGPAPSLLAPDATAQEAAPAVPGVLPAASIEAGGEAAPPASKRQTAATGTPDETAVDGLGIALESGLLDDQRGGFDLGPAQPSSGILSTGVVGDNRAVDVATGSNAIRDGAFANASGIPVVIQNTGANVLIQSATIVNVQLH